MKDFDSLIDGGHYLVKGPEVEKITSDSARTRFDQIRAGEHPPPDFPATKRGEADKWWASTIFEHLAKKQAAAQATSLAQRSRPNSNSTRAVRPRTQAAVIAAKAAKVRRRLQSASPATRE